MRDFFLFILNLQMKLLMIINYLNTQQKQKGKKKTQGIFWTT